MRMHGMEYFKIFITMLCYTFSDIMFDHPSDYGRNYAFHFFSTTVHKIASQIILRVV
jgi:hypothetical protein